MNTEVLFSRASDEWETPDDLYGLLDQEFGFTLDPCATPENAKTGHFYTIEDDGLQQGWAGVVYVNPPYSQIGKWAAKAIRESRVYKRATVVMLVPARTDTRWWHISAPLASEIRFIQGRLRFKGAASSAPFPSAILVFRPARLLSEEPVVTFWNWRSELCSGQTTT